MHRSIFGFLRGMLVRCQRSEEKSLRRCTDICFLQEVKWRGKGDKMIGNRYKLLWNGLRKRENGVAAMVANRLVKKILEVEWTVTGL